MRAPLKKIERLLSALISIPHRHARQPVGRDEFRNLFQLRMPLSENRPPLFRDMR
jgi:hypothetical protein